MFGINLPRSGKNAPLAHRRTQICDVEPITITRESLESLLLKKFRIEKPPDKLFRYRSLANPGWDDSDIPVYNPLEPTDGFGFEVLFRKSPEWAYEEEWRSVVTQHAHQHAFNPEALTGVIFGCEISNEHAELVRSWMLARVPIPKLYRARKLRHLAGLEIVEEPLT
jgi:hypothetical protein